MIITKRKHNSIMERLSDLIDERDKEIEDLKRENRLDSNDYQEAILELRKELKDQEKRHSEELKALECKYKDEVRDLKREVKIRGLELKDREHDIESLSATVTRLDKELMGMKEESKNSVSEANVDVIANRLHEAEATILNMQKIIDEAKIDNTELQRKVDFANGNRDHFIDTYNRLKAKYDKHCGKLIHVETRDLPEDLTDRLDRLKTISLADNTKDLENPLESIELIDEKKILIPKQPPTRVVSMNNDDTSKLPRIMATERVLDPFVTEESCSKGYPKKKKKNKKRK